MNENPLSLNNVNFSNSKDPSNEYKMLKIVTIDLISSDEKLPQKSLFFQKSHNHSIKSNEIKKFPLICKYLFKFNPYFNNTRIHRISFYLIFYSERSQSNYSDCFLLFLMFSQRNFLRFGFSGQLERQFWIVVLCKSFEENEDDRFVCFLLNLLSLSCFS